MQTSWYDEGMRRTTAQELPAEIRAIPSGDTRPVIVTLSGPSGAGKSTLADRLQDELGANILPTDAYYLPDHLIPAIAIEDGVVHYDNPATMQLGRLATDICKLREGHVVNLPDTGEEIEPSRHIIIEGIVANYPTIRSLAALSVCLNAPPDIRLARRQERELAYGRSAEMTRWAFEHLVEPDYQHFHALHDQHVDLVIVT